MARKGQPIGRPEDIESIARKGFGITEEDLQATINDAELNAEADALYGPVKQKPEEGEPNESA